jgi:hypothetical protein
MFKGKAGYYLILGLFLVAAAWIGYLVTAIIRSNPWSLTTLIWISLITAAVIVGIGIVYFSTKRRHGEQEIPCNIRDTDNVKVNNYHLIMATSRSQKKRGIAMVKSTDLVNGIAVEPFNKDAQPHRIRIEVRVNEDSHQIAVKEFVINAGAAVDVALPLPRLLRLAEIAVVDIRVRQV